MTMDRSGDDSDSDVSIGMRSPVQYVKPQLSSKATAFSIDALIGKRSASLDSVNSLDDTEDVYESHSPKRQCFDSGKKSPVACLAPLGEITFYCNFLDI